MIYYFLDKWIFIYFGIMKFPFELSRHIRAPGRAIFGFHIHLRPEAYYKPGVLANIFKIISDLNVNVVSTKLSIPEFEKKIALAIFIDLTGKEELLDVLRERINGVREVKSIEVIEPVYPGFTYDKFFFPLTFIGERAIIFRRSAYLAFIKELRRKLGTAYEAALYYIGYEMGRRYFRSHKSLAYGDIDRAVRVGEALFQEAGFGILKWVEFDEKNKITKAEVLDSFECELFKDEKRKSSHFIRGLLAGWVSEMWKIPMIAIEEKCIALGDERCTFYIKKKEERV